jgi:hypothetical protein
LTGQKVHLAAGDTTIVESGNTLRGGALGFDSQVFVANRQPHHDRVHLAVGRERVDSREDRCRWEELLVSLARKPFTGSPTREFSPQIARTPPNGV